jgi:hypothetical protein
MTRGGVEGLDGQAVTGGGGVDAQRHVGVELGPQAALDALEGPDAGGEVVGDALHVRGVARADGEGLELLRVGHCVSSGVVVAEAAEAVAAEGVDITLVCGERRRASASYSAVLYFGKHGSLQQLKRCLQ